MKRFVTFAVCGAVLFAGILSALAQCKSLAENGSWRNAARNLVVAHEHNGAHHAHHSQTDGTQIHCPNPFADFVPSSRVSLHAHARSFKHLRHVVLPTTVMPLHPTVADLSFEPPGPVAHKSLSRHLLLTVIVI